MSGQFRPLQPPTSETSDNGSNLASQPPLIPIPDGPERPTRAHTLDSHYRQQANGPHTVQRQVSDPERKGQNPPLRPQPPHSKIQAQFPPSSSSSSGEDSSPARSPQRSPSSHLFVPSRLGPPPGKPGAPPHPQNFRFVSQNTMNSAHFHSAPSTLNAGSRGSMILYRLASDDMGELVRPRTLNPDRNSVGSSGDRDSVISASSDSKYPIANMLSKERGFVPYVYDPLLDIDDDPALDALHDPKVKIRGSTGSWRGLANYAGLAILLLALLCLFIGYPVVLFSHGESLSEKIADNPRINSSGQAVDDNIPVDGPSRRWLVPEVQDDQPLPDVFARTIPG